MAKKKIDPMESQFLGKWRITEMPDFEEDTIDEEGPAFIEFEKSQTGNFHFIYAHGEMDVRFTEPDGRPRAGFAWIGNEENDDAFGRGYAPITEDGTMTGRILFFQGDEYDSTAEEKGEKKPVKRGKGR